jgi:hypothetical protein
MGIIENIDVLWLKGGSIVAAFEVEASTSIYSGLLRMSDLLAEVPNLSIPLYVVAPDERRHKVLSEITRPTFERRDSPLRDVCQYISFTRLAEALDQVGPFVSALRAEDFIAQIAESADDPER